MTIIELREFIQSVGLDTNAKIVILIAKAGEDNYQVVKCDNDGKLITTA